ncbi:hypothetical protein GEMRC1_004936 [Eukaryota sp. GEM-RC1]
MRLSKLNSDVFRKSGQFGVSCPNGSEAIVHYLRSLRFSHPSSRIISVDIRNAFNCVDRIQMLKAVKQFPDLLPFFFWSYSTPSDLFFDNHCLSSSQGVRQGDPLGPFLYSLTTLPVLSWLNSLSGVSCVAYLDDTYIVIDSDVDSSDLLNQLSQKYADLGLDLNLDKTKIFATFDNFVALGSPIGDSAFEKRWLKEKCTLLFPLFKTISKLPVQAQLLFNSVCSFFQVAPQIIFPRTSFLDFFSLQTAIPYPDLLSFPVSLGGFGLADLSLICEIPNAVSLFSSNSVIPSLYSFPSPIVKLTLSTLKPILLDSDNALPKGAQKKLTRIFFSDRAEIFASSLPSNLLSVHNACQLPFSGRFLSLIPSCRDLTLQDSSLRWICRHRLLCSQDIVSCNLCSFSSVDAGHSSNCNSCSRHRTFRHDEIKNLIAEHTSFAVEFKLKLGAAYGVIDLFDPTSKLGLDVAVVGGNGHLP